MDFIDVVLACGQTGLDIYDYAEAALVPYVKVTADQDPTWMFAPLFENPDLVISHGLHPPLPACFSVVPKVQLSSTADLPKAVGAMETLAKNGKVAGQCKSTSYPNLVSCCSSSLDVHLAVGHVWLGSSCICF
jgi:hypothetical protein